MAGGCRAAFAQAGLVSSKSNVELKQARALCPHNFRRSLGIHFRQQIFQFTSFSKSSHPDRVAFLFGGNVTKEEIIAAIRNCADELGRVPTVAELKEMRRITLRTIRRFFGRYADALREAGFDPHGQGYKLDLDTLFQDWAGVARLVGKLPGLNGIQQGKPLQRRALADTFWRMDGCPAWVVAICKGKGTRKRMGRCTQNAGGARG